MENKHKKSKALIITIIVLILLLIFGYLIYKNRDVFGVKTSASIAKIFSPLIPSDNSKNLSKIDGNSQRTSAQAGEDIKGGDNVSVSGSDSNNNPIIVKSGSGDTVFGFASQDIANGDIGEVIINSGASNTFWDSFSGFLGGLLGKNTTPEGGTGGGGSYQCTKDGVIVDCSTLGGGGTGGGGSYQCTKDGVIVDCSTLGGGGTGGGGNYQCTKDGVVIDCSNTLGGGTGGGGNYQCTKDGVVIDCSQFNEFCLLNPDSPSCNGGGTGGLTVTNPLPLPCSSPKITDTETGQCINASDCKSPKVVNGNKCEVPVPTACLSPKITDTTGQCIDQSQCLPPKVVNGNKCTNKITPPNICLDIEQNPLTFTNEEKARLAVLLRNFYLVSSTLKTADDISTTYNELDQQKNFISQIEDLTKQCYCQVDGIDLIGGQTNCKNLMGLPLPLSKPSFQSTWTRHGNPWYSETPNTSSRTFPYTNGTFPYTNKIIGYLNNTQLEGATVKDQCKVVSGYYYGTKNDGKTNCSVYNTTFKEYGDCAENKNTKRYVTGGLPDKSVLDAGCKWQDGVDLQNTERILNIW